MNTRQYPRTLNQAFPKTADYASAIERSRPAGYPTAWWIAMAICAVLTLGVVL